MRTGLQAREIRAMALAGELYTDDYLTKSGEGQWRPASTLAELPVRKRPAVAAVAVATVPTVQVPAVAATAAPVRIGPSEREVADLKAAASSAARERDDLRALVDEVVAERDGLSATCDALIMERTGLRSERDAAREDAAVQRGSREETEADQRALRHALEEAAKAQQALTESRRSLEASHQAALRETQADHERALGAMSESMRAEAESHNDRQLRHAVDALTEERDSAHRRADDATADREELVAALGHAQDSLRVSDDLRRAIEKTANSSKIAVQEQVRELAQSRAMIQELQGTHNALLARAEGAEAAAAHAVQVEADAREWVVRATEQRDAAVRAREEVVAERDAALEDRDATRLAIGATQTDLVKTRRAHEDSISEGQSLRAALSEQTGRASGLERALSHSQSEGHDAATRRDELVATVASLEGELTRLNAVAAEQHREGEGMRLRIDEEAVARAGVTDELAQARQEVASLHGELASAREGGVAALARVSVVEREAADERSKIVARDELIFRESLRSEERESEIRRLTGTIAALKADLDTEHRRADDALAIVAKGQGELAVARKTIGQQTADMVDAHNEIESLAKIEQSARAALTAASAERDQVAAALTTAQAEVASREQQVSAERALREQAEASSRQLLASYEKLSDEAGRRITDLEVKLTEAAHQATTITMREEHALASLAESHSQVKALAQKLAQVEEQRASVIRDRDSYAKQLKTEAAARAAAEDKIAKANERATKAEREGRHALERAVQASMIALGGAKQRLDEDYAKSRAEVEVLEQLVAEATNRVIATGGTVPGLPLMPREAAIAARAAADAAALIAAQASITAPTSPTRGSSHERKEDSEKPAGPPVTFRLIDAIADEVPGGRPATRGSAQPSAKRDTSGAGSDHPSAPARVNQPSVQGRFGGQRERVSQPSRRPAESGSDDDSSSRLDRAWLDDHSAADTTETPPNSAALLALTALGVVMTASVAAIPKFAALEVRAGILSIAAWATALPLAVGLVQLVALKCRPILARRIPALAATLCIAAPLGSLAMTSAPGVTIALLAALAMLPWIVAAAAWPDARQLDVTRAASRELDALDGRGTKAGFATAACALAAGAASCFPWVIGGAPVIGSAIGGTTALLALATAAMALTPTLRPKAAMPAWALAMIALGGACASVGTVGIAATLAQATLAWVVMLAAAWSTAAAATVAAASSRELVARAIARLSGTEAPALVAHERSFAAVVMFASAALPLAPALCAWRLVQGRSRRAESQLRSFLEFEIWSAIALGVSLIAGAIAPDSVGLALVWGALLCHGAIALGGGCSIAMDRFVRFPSPMQLLARPEQGLDLPLPLVTVQRTAEHSPHRPIVHPCATPAWACADVALGAAAVWMMTGSAAWGATAGTIAGLAAWLPSFVASRTRHQDALIIGMLTTAILVALACAGLMLGAGGAEQGTPVLAALVGAGMGMWGLLLGWAASGARHMATSSRSSLGATIGADGDPLAPQECPIAVRGRDEAIRRLAIGCGTLAIASAAVPAFPWVGPVVWTPVSVAGAFALLVVAAVTASLALCDLDTVAAYARRLRALMLGLAATTTLPIIFSATSIGVVETIRSIPFSIVTAVLILVGAAVLSGLVPASADRSEGKGPSRPGRPVTHPARRERTARANEQQEAMS